MFLESKHLPMREEKKKKWTEELIHNGRDGKKVTFMICLVRIFFLWIRKIVIFILQLVY